VAAYRYWSVGLSGEGAPERAQGYRVTGDTFALLGVRPQLGRALEPLDAAPGAPRVVVLSHGLWQRRFAADPGVVGRALRLDGEPHTVVGVMPARFEFPVYNFKGELWTPLPVDKAAALADPGASGSVVALGRLRKGGSPQAAEAEVRAAFLRHAAASPQTFRSLGVRVLPLQELGARARRRSSPCSRRARGAAARLRQPRRAAARAGRRAPGAGCCAPRREPHATHAPAPVRACCSLAGCPFAGLMIAGWALGAQAALPEPRVRRCRTWRSWVDGRTLAFGTGSHRHGWPSHLPACAGRPQPARHSRPAAAASAQPQRRLRQAW
jgi:hypothetical protein